MQTLVTAGGDLFHIAAQQLAMQPEWVRIAQANNLADPFLQGLVTLVIPDTNPAAGGGIGNQ